MGVRGIPRRFEFPWRTLLDIRRDVDDELDFHLAMRQDTLVAGGLDPEAARRQALAEFGDVPSARRSLKTEGWRAERRRRRHLMFEELWRDLRLALRSLSKRPGFTLVAVLALALGIGVNSAIFSLVNLLAFRPIQMVRSDEVVGLYGQSLERPDQYRAFSYPTYVDIREQNDVFTELAAMQTSVVGLRDGETMRRVMTGLVSSNFFEMLGVPPRLGRAFSLQEERPGAQNPAAILSDGLWKRLGASEDIVGTTIHVNGIDVTVVGVTPEGFTGTTALLSPELWLPLGLYDRVAGFLADGPVGALSDRDEFALMVVGRLRSGVSVENANAKLEVLGTRLRETYPKSQQDQTLVASPLARLGLSTAPRSDDALTIPLMLLMAMSGAVLLIACLDLTNMFLARGESRRAEVAVRVALGGSRFRLIRQQLTEGFLLSLAGGVLGLFGAFWATRLLFSSFENLVPMGIHFVIDATPDARVFAATFGFCVLATLLFGFGPAWRLTGGNVFASLKDRASSGTQARSGRRPTFRSVLVLAQLALSMVLLVAAGLFVRGAMEAEKATPGFLLDGGVLAEIDTGLIGYDEARSRDLMGRLLERMRSLPDVEGASFATIVPFGPVTMTNRVQASGASGDDQVAVAHRYIVTDGYFDSLDLPILQGRDFTRTESHSEGGAPVVIIDEPLARELWPDGDAVGQWLVRPVKPPAEPMPPMQVIGVVPGVLHDFTDDEAPPHIYLPLGQNWSQSLHLHVRMEERLTEGNAALLQRVRDEIRGIDERLPIVSLKTLNDHRESSVFVWIVRAGARVFGTFGALALFLALVGVYGVKAFVVSRRTREIGLRLALGATPQVVLRQMLRESVTQTLAGLGVGLVLALGTAKLLSSLLYRVPATDPWIFGGAALLLGVAAIAATWLPVQRASRIAPATVLREE